MGFLDNTFPELLSKSFLQLNEHSQGFGVLSRTPPSQTVPLPMSACPVKKHFFTCMLSICLWHCCMVFADRTKKGMFPGGSVQVWGQRIYSGCFACLLRRTLLILSCSHVIPEKQVLCCNLPFHSAARAKFCSNTPAKSINEHRASLYMGNIFYPRRDFRINTKNYLAGLIFL